MNDKGSAVLSSPGKGQLCARGPSPVTFLVVSQASQLYGSKATYTGISWGWWQRLPTAHRAGDGQPTPASQPSCSPCSAALPLSARWRDSLTRTRCASPVGTLWLPSSENLLAKKIQVDNARARLETGNSTVLTCTAELERLVQTISPRPKAGILQTLPTQIEVSGTSCLHAPWASLEQSQSCPLTNRRQGNTVIALTRNRSKAWRIYFVLHVCPPVPQTRARSSRWSFSPGTFARKDFQCKEELSTSQC